MMGIYQHAKKFAGKTVDSYEVGKPLKAPGTKAIRIGCKTRYGEADVELNEQLASVLLDPNVGKIKALVVGCWNDAWEGFPPDDAIEQLVGARSRMPNLKALFFGDITAEEYEISWIRQGDIAPLLAAYDQLEELTLRGGSGLRIGHSTHKKLKKLRVESGGLNADFVRQLSGCRFPALEELDLWLGQRGYGGNTTLEDLQPLLNGSVFPKLKYLGLRNYDQIGACVADIARAKIIGKVQTLDLSMGTLNDEESEPLLSIPALKKLKLLDLSTNYVSPEMGKRLKKAGVKVKVADSREREAWWNDEDYRYTVVGE